MAKATSNIGMSRKDKKSENDEEEEQVMLVFDTMIMSKCLVLKLCCMVDEDVLQLLVDVL